MTDSPGLDFHQWPWESSFPSPVEINFMLFPKRNSIPFGFNKCSSAPLITDGNLPPPTFFNFVPSALSRPWFGSVLLALRIAGVAEMKAPAEIEQQALARRCGLFQTPRGHPGRSGRPRARPSLRRRQRWSSTLTSGPVGHNRMIAFPPLAPHHE